MSQRRMGEERESLEKRGMVWIDREMNLDDK